MKSLLQFNVIVLLFVFVLATDEAITNATEKSYIRAIAYSIVALLALIALIVALIV